MIRDKSNPNASSFSPNVAFSASGHGFYIFIYQSARGILKFISMTLLDRSAARKVTIRRRAGRLAPGVSAHRYG